MEESTEKLNHEGGRRAEARRARNHSTMTSYIKVEDLMNIKELSHSRSSAKNLAVQEIKLPDDSKFFERQTNRDFNVKFNTMMKKDVLIKSTYKKS